MPDDALALLPMCAHAGLGVQNRAAMIKILAEQRAGALLAEVERSKGGLVGIQRARANLQARAG